MRDAPGLDALSFAELTFEMRPTRTVELPPFLGSTLRGALGHALRQTGCLRRCEDVRRCPFRETCAYAYCFETPPPVDAQRLRNQTAVPHPFVLRAPAPRRDAWTPGDTLRCSVLLVGRGTEYYPYFFAAMERAAAEGLGRDRVPFRLERVGDGDGTLLWIPGAPACLAPGVDHARPLFDATAPDEATLRFTTPVRIVRDHRLGATLDFRAFAGALLRRVSSLLYFHCGAGLDVDFRGLLERATQVRTVRDRLRMVPLDRWSNRQQASVPIDGLVGEVTWQGASVAELWPLIRIGEVIHVGKNTSMGQGRYEVLRA